MHVSKISLVVSVPPHTLAFLSAPSPKKKQNYKEFDWKKLHVFFPPACYEEEVLFVKISLLPSADA
jgi:hypothetical protein